MTIQRIYRTFIYILKTLGCFFTVSRKKLKIFTSRKNQERNIKYLMTVLGT